MLNASKERTRGKEEAQMSSSPLGGVAVVGQALPDIYKTVIP